jgi:hypothetical protein
VATPLYRSATARNDLFGSILGLIALVRTATFGATSPSARVSAKVSIPPNLAVHVCHRDRPVSGKGDDLFAKSHVGRGASNAIATKSAIALEADPH